MEDQKRHFYVKRSQRDYSMSFKLGVVGEVERGELSQTGAARKYGIQSHSTIWRMRGKRDVASHVIAQPLGIRQQLPRLGVKKLYYLLEEPLQELGVGRDKLYAILRTNNLLIKPKRSYRTTTNSRYLFLKHTNLVQDCVPRRPEHIWVGDITYIGGRSRNTYLALITDAYSKKIVGYDLSNSLDASGCVRALKMASRG